MVRNKKTSLTDSVSNHDKNEKTATMTYRYPLTVLSTGVGEVKGTRLKTNFTHNRSSRATMANIYIYDKPSPNGHILIANNCFGNVDVFTDFQWGNL